MECVYGRFGLKAGVVADGRKSANLRYLASIHFFSYADGTTAAANEHKTHQQHH